MKKTIVTILLCGVMVLGITCCGSKKSNEHSFSGKVIEVSSSYIIVEPNENEEERKSSDKFRIELKNDNTSYELGTNVRITYVGEINESYPAQIGTTKIEIEKTKLADKRYSKTIENTTLEMYVPNEWKYEEISLEDNYKFALKIYKYQEDDYFVLYYYNEPFGVCGTGRNEQKLNLDNGKVAKIGYYDADKAWSDISFYDINPNIAFINYGTEDSEVFSFIKTIDIKINN